MIDDELRGLERIALASGAPEDWKRFYERRKRAGILNPSGVKFCKLVVGANTEVLRIVCQAPEHTIGVTALEEVRKEWARCQTSVPFSIKTVGARDPFGDQEIILPWEQTVSREGFMFRYAPFFGGLGGTVEISCPEFLEPHSAGRVFINPPPPRGFARPATPQERAQLDRLRSPRPSILFQNPPAPAPGRLADAVRDITPSFPAYVAPVENWIINPLGVRVTHLWSKAVPSERPASPSTPPSAAPLASSPAPQPLQGDPATEPPPRSE